MALYTTLRCIALSRTLSDAVCQFDFLDLILVLIESYLRFSFTLCVACTRENKVELASMKKKTNRKKNLDLVVVLLQSNELDLQDAIFYRSVQWSDSSFYFLFDAPRFVLLIRRFVSRIKESNS